MIFPGTQIRDAWLRSKTNGKYRLDLESVTVLCQCNVLQKEDGNQFDKWIQTTIKLVICWSVSHYVSVLFCGWQEHIIFTHWNVNSLIPRRYKEHMWQIKDGPTNSVTLSLDKLKEWWLGCLRENQFQLSQKARPLTSCENFRNKYLERTPGWVRNLWFLYVLNGHKFQGSFRIIHPQLW